MSYSLDWYTRKAKICRKYEKSIIRILASTRLYNVFVYINKDSPKQFSISLLCNSSIVLRKPKLMIRNSFSGSNIAWSQIWYRLHHFDMYTRISLIFAGSRERLFLNNVTTTTTVVCCCWNHIHCILVVK